MTLQSTPPLPDPSTGRIPEYTQTLQQDPNTGQWTVMYDVSDSPASSSGVIDMNIIQDQDPFTDVITELPSGPDDQMGWLDPSPEPAPEDPYILPVAQPGGGGGRSDPEPGGYVTGLDGNYYSTEDGSMIDPTSWTHKMLKAIQNYNVLVSIGSRVNNMNEMSKMPMEAQRNMFTNKSFQKSWGELSDDDQEAFRENLAVNARRNKVPASQVTLSNRRSSGLGGEEGPPGTPDPITGRMDRRAPPGAISRQDGRDSTFGAPTPAQEPSRPSTPPGAVARGSSARRTSQPAASRPSTPPGRVAAGTAAGGGGGVGRGPGPGTHSGRGAAPPGSGASRGGGNGGGNGGGGGGSGGCFVKGTMIEMLDGTTKEITSIETGEETKGGTIIAKMEFMPTSIYDYKGVKVSGTHWVIEDNQFIEIENSKHGILTDEVEPVYSFKTSNNRIWIDDIEFGDFETGSDDDWEPYFEAVKKDLNKKLRGEA